MPFGLTPGEIINHYATKYGFPVTHGFPVGHEPRNMALVVGQPVRLTVDETGTRLAAV